jgi:hypothetical protein
MAGGYVGTKKPAQQENRQDGNIPLLAVFLKLFSLLKRIYE